MVNFFGRNQHGIIYYTNFFGLCDAVNFRAIPITTELRAFDGIIDVYMLDPKGRIMKRWLSRQVRLF